MKASPSFLVRLTAASHAFARDKRGLTTLEYSVLFCVIGAGGLGAWSIVSKRMQNQVDQANSNFTTTLQKHLGNSASPSSLPASSNLQQRWYQPGPNEVPSDATSGGQTKSRGSSWDKGGGQNGVAKQPGRADDQPAKQPGRAVDSQEGVAKQPGRADDSQAAVAKQLGRGDEGQTSPSTKPGRRVVVSKQPGRADASRAAVANQPGRAVDSQEGVAKHPGRGDDSQDSVAKQPGRNDASEYVAKEPGRGDAPVSKQPRR